MDRARVPSIINKNKGVMTLPNSNIEKLHSMKKSSSKKELQRLIETDMVDTYNRKEKGVSRYLNKREYSQKQKKELNYE
jgi:glycerol-3-phosphate responsive antiterminator